MPAPRGNPPRAGGAPPSAPPLACVDGAERCCDRVPSADIPCMPDLSAILRLEVPVIVQLGRRTMKMDEVLSLVPGAIIELPKNADEELDLLVNNKQIGLGTAVKVVENFGIRITYIGDLKQRIRAMGGTLTPSATEAEADAAA